MSSTFPNPTLAQLQRILRYVPETGELHWLDPKRPGRPSACKSTRAGYMVGASRVIRAGGWDYNAGSIAWTFSRGSWPPSYVFTVNGYPDDLRAENLTLERNDRAKLVDKWEALQRALNALNRARSALEMPPVPWSVASEQAASFGELVASPEAFDPRPKRATYYGLRARQADAARDFGQQAPDAPAAPSDEDLW